MTMMRILMIGENMSSDEFLSDSEDTDSDSDLLRDTRVL